MVTEEQRLRLLQILSFTLTDMDRIIAELKRRGITTTPEEINAAIDQLKQVRGC
jgi:hypothetical protein